MFSMNHKIIYHFKHTALILLIHAFLINCNPVGKQSDLTLATQYQYKLQTVLNNILFQHQGVGGVLGLQFSDGSIFIDSTGWANLDPTNPTLMSTDNHFRMGSITKTFIGTAILLLVQQEKLNLSDTIEEWLPNLIPNGSQITIRMLLNHTSGLFDFTWSEELYIDPYINDLSSPWAPLRLIEIATHYGPVAEPGEVAIYCNTNYVLLGLIIEAAALQDAENFIYEEILKPLNLTGTIFPTSPPMPTPYTHGYLDLDENGMLTPDEDVTIQHPSAIWTAGAMISTPKDLLKWIYELNNSQLLTDTLQAERLAFETEIHGTSGNYFGLGIAKLDDGIGHTGSLPGYQSIIMKFRETYFVIYTNNYLLGDTAVNITNKIYAAAVKTIYPDAEVDI